MANTTPAWLLPIAVDIKLSIGDHEAAEYLEAPVLQHIPLAPDYCKNIIFWQDRIVPVIDMNILYGNPAAINQQHIMVVAYQERDNTPLKYIAFILASAPEKILVDDDDACEIPESYPEKLSAYVISLFNYNQQITSVLDIARLTSGHL